MKKIFSTLLFTILLSFSLFCTQTTVDFSGVWLLNKERSQFQLKILEKLEKGIIKIDHEEPDFRLSRVFTMDGKNDSLTLELTTDGKEKISQEGNQKHISRLFWEGDTLVFITRIIAPQGEATNIVRYRLKDSGRTLEAEEQFRGPRLKYDNLWVLDKNSKDSKS